MKFSSIRREPAVTPPPPPRQTTPPAARHETTAKALAYVNELQQDVEHLREENGRLRADLNLSMMRCRDVESLLINMQGDMERYRQYAVEVKTHLSLIVDVALKANEAALDAGDKPMPDKQAEEVINSVEREMAELVKQQQQPAGAST